MKLCTRCGGSGRVGVRRAKIWVACNSTNNIATMDPTTFATNRTPALPNTTTMGALGTATVTLAPSIGSLPNNWNIDIDLAAIGATLIFDPTSAEPNLLIDISYVFLDPRIRY